MAGVGAGSRLLDVACGAGSQTLDAAHRVGARGCVVASDISDKMLHHVQENACAAGHVGAWTHPAHTDARSLHPFVRSCAGS